MPARPPWWRRRRLRHSSLCVAFRWRSIIGSGLRPMASCASRASSWWMAACPDSRPAWARGVVMNWETFLVPYGPDTSPIIHAIGFASRAALTFGGLKPGGLKETREILLYNQRRVFAFVLALGELDDEKYATAAGAINFGFPVIANTDIPEILPSGICTYEHVVSNVAHRDMP